MLVIRLSALVVSGIRIYKKINPGLSRVWPGRPGPGSTLRVDRVWPDQFPACFLLRPGPATGPGPGLTRRAGPGLKTLSETISF